MFRFDMNPTRYYPTLPPLDPGVSFVELTYSTAKGDEESTIPEMRRMYAGCDVMFAAVTYAPPYSRGSIVFDLQWICRLATCVFVRTTEGLNHESALPHVIRHWKPGGRILLVTTKTVNERNGWVNFARRWCRRGTELFAQGWGDGADDICGACSADFCACRVEDAARDARELDDEVAFSSWYAFLRAEREPSEHK